MNTHRSAYAPSLRPSFSLRASTGALGLRPSTVRPLLCPLGRALLHLFARRTHTPGASILPSVAASPHPIRSKSIDTSSTPKLSASLRPLSRLHGRSLVSRKTSEHSSTRPKPPHLSASSLCSFHPSPLSVFDPFRPPSFAPFSLRPLSSAIPSPTWVDALTPPASFSHTCSILCNYTPRGFLHSYTEAPSGRSSVLRRFVVGCIAQSPQARSCTYVTMEGFIPRRE
ncbi:hypothetical protein BDN70DRAFT_490640 [Pholiota conissans]|uniref:Uncharacterized protein n=1 Tax=Pholiota conissans TaxID=109636 RepID=A0A9P5YPD2_9AGAR|nr:hypothetical protein BDN70DRAFT_490640 [Pholiota conissans]